MLCFGGPEGTTAHMMFYSRETQKDETIWSFTARWISGEGEQTFSILHLEFGSLGPEQGKNYDVLLPFSLRCQPPRRDETRRVDIVRKPFFRKQKKKASTPV